MTTKTATKFYPSADRVLVKPLEAADRTEAGIYLPEQAKKEQTRGTVIAVGPGKREESAIGGRIRIAFDEGQIVVYGKYAGSKIEIDGEEFVILSEDEVYGVLAEEEE